jgi:endo-1,3-1,4-beta-glycanase ExoK
MFNCTWRDDSVNFSNGIMTLTINKDTKGGSKPYAGGEYTTNSTYGFGLYQVKMKPAKNVGVVSSFFTYTGKNPWDEIDIEFEGKDTTRVQFNYFTNGIGNHEYHHNLGFDASASYHTYAFNWQPKYIAWMVDGVEVYRVNNNIPSHPGQIMMNLWPGIGKDTWLGSYDGLTPIKAYYDGVDYNSAGATNATTKLGWNQDSTGWWYCLANVYNNYYKDGWKFIDGEWYSFDYYGYARQSTWFQDGGKWYYLQNSCKMAKNTITPDGYKVDSNGAWIQ